MESVKRLVHGEIAMDLKKLIFFTTELISVLAFCAILKLIL